MGFHERADVFHCAADGHGSGVEELAQRVSSVIAPGLRRRGVGRLSRCRRERLKFPHRGCFEIRLPRRTPKDHWGMSTSLRLASHWRWL